MPVLALDEHTCPPVRKCKKCALKRAIEWQEKNHSAYSDRHRRWRLQRYGLTVEDYDRMLESQDYRCAICGSKDPKSNGRFHVDHDHRTGKVRGLLCYPCNALLGYAADNIETLANSIAYLEGAR